MTLKLLYCMNYFIWQVLSIQKKGVFSGFSQSYFDKDTNKKISFGSGINEGYTEYLTKRYFARYIQNSNYKDLVSFVREIEKIIGYEKMEKLYFHADLKGLILELSKYISEEEIMKFINNVDFYNKHKFDKNARKLLEVTLKEIDEFLNKLKENAMTIDKTKQK